MYIDMRLQFLGEVRRQDLVRRFGIQTASATRDLALYRDERPGNLEYVSHTKSYVRAATFEPLFESVTGEDAFAWLSPGLGQSGMLDPEIRVVIDRGPPTTTLNAKVLAVLVRAIVQRHSAQITYLSPDSQIRSKVIAPHSLADIKGLRLVRAYDLDSRTFVSLFLPWIFKAEERSECDSSFLPPEQDSGWKTMRTLDLVPHPDNVRNPKALLLAHGVEQGSSWRPVIREALAEIWLQAMGVDTTKAHNCRGDLFKWWLRGSGGSQ